MNRHFLHLKQKWFDTTLLYLQRSNPFVRVVVLMFNLNVLPYQTFGDAVHNRIDNGRLRRMYLVCLLMAVNVVRYIILSITDDNQIKYFLVQALPNIDNGRPFHIAIMLLFWTPTLMCMFDSIVFL